MSSVQTYENVASRRGEGRGDRTKILRWNDVETEKFPNVAKLSETLGRNVFVYDTETTGLGRNGGHVGIVSLGIMKIDPSGHARSCYVVLDPEVPIEEGASKVHGFYQKDVVGCPKFSDVAGEIFFYMENAFVTGFNNKGYDDGVIAKNFERVGLVKPDMKYVFDVRDLWITLYQDGKSQKGKLAEVGEKMGIPLGVGHHSLGDVETTVRVLEKMIEHKGIEPIIDVIRNPRTIVLPKKDFRRFPDKKSSGPQKNFQQRPDDPIIDAELKNVLSQGQITSKTHGMITNKTGKPFVDVAFYINRKIASGDIPLNKCSYDQKMVKTLSDIILTNNLQKLPMSKIRQTLASGSGVNVQYYDVAVALSLSKTRQNTLTDRTR